jgi:hypothetical protein
MSSYRALIEGRNFLIALDGKPRRLGFYQTVFVAAADPGEAEAAAIRAVKDDVELKEMAQNEAHDPPMLYLESLEQLDDSESLQVAEGRTYYVEKHWWQFWR